MCTTNGSKTYSEIKRVAASYNIRLLAEAVCRSLASLRFNAQIEKIVSLLAVALTSLNSNVKYPKGESGSCIYLCVNCKYVRIPKVT